MILSICAMGETEYEQDQAAGEGKTFQRKTNGSSG